MIDAYSPDQVRAAEAALPDELASGELMQRAAKGVAQVVRARLAEHGGTRVVALVGPGNNGADALWALARVAKKMTKKGVGCTAVCLDPQISPAHRDAAAEAEARGAVVLTADGPEALAAIEAADLVVDGVLGIGGRAGVPDFAASWFAAIADEAYVLAVDLPSGQPPEGGPLVPGAVFADETVTFGAPKPVHLLPPTSQACGLLTVVDIGLDLTADEPVARAMTRAAVAERWPVPATGDDKYSRGVLGVIAGGEQYTGAAVLTTTAAVCAGAGMVRYVGTPGPEALVRAAVPEVVPGPGQVQAWVIGPGLEATSRAKGAKAQLDVAREALASDLPVLVDAGGLDLVAGRRAAPTLLTPHAGECARLLTRLRGRKTDLPRSQVEADPVGHAQALARESGATVLLKGSTTVVAEPDAQVVVAAEAPAWLATAGTGDVLAGLVGALLAAGLAPAEAGAVGAVVHGVAAEHANPGGPVRALAVAQALPATIASLLSDPPRGI